ncbi:MAG TPA: DUF3298 domain-containing protein [Flavipsychrobacter sp.]
MKKSGLLIIVALLLHACGEDKAPISRHQQVIQEEGFIADTLCGEYRRYMGTVAGQPVVLHYTQYGNMITCQYYYVSQGKNILLYNTTDNPNSIPLIFVERPETEKQEEPASWHIVIEDDSLKGEWISGNREVAHPILLKEDYTNGAQQFSIVCMTDSMAFSDSLPEPKASTSYEVLLPVGDDEGARFVRTAIYNCIGCDSIAGDDIKSCLDGLKTKYFNDYKHVSDEEKKLFKTTSSFGNWSEQTNFWVVYNDDGLVVLNHHVYAYTGGAHGNYGSRYLCIDSRDKKLLKLDDVLQVDTARLVRILEQEARKLYKIADEAPLYENLLTEELYIPEQFYISNKGVTFVYGIYEVASYADGEISLFVPYSKIMGMLTPYFKQRMKLDLVAGSH